MADVAHNPVESEAPVNPYSLLDAVNRSSGDAHTAWVIFLGLMSYFIIAVAGISHKDLLLNTHVPLPIVQVKIELTRFFLFAPVVLVLIHLGVIMQHVLLARKAIEFDIALRSLEATRRRSHPLRLELHNFFFVQGVAGPDRSFIMTVFLQGMAWLTLVMLPVILILYIQVVFLPYHSVGITWAHRIALGADIFMLITMGVFLLRAETSFFRALWRTGRSHPLSVIVTTVVLTLVSIFSFFVATVPGEFLDRVARSLPGVEKHAKASGDGAYLIGYVMPFLGKSEDGSLFGIFHKNLYVTDVDLVEDRKVTKDEPTIILRNRDLRFARLDRSDLHQADLTGANLEGAWLVGADLRGARLTCKSVAMLQNTGDRRAAGCTRARGADFTRARLDDAIMTGIDLERATLEEASLRRARLTDSRLSRANFTSAHLEGADLASSEIHLTNFLLASMQGADLTGAKLYFADLTGAGLQGAILHHAHLIGANLLSAKLGGAMFKDTRLYGSDLTGADATATDFRDSLIWETKPFGPGDAAKLADFSGLKVQPISGDLLTTLKGWQSAEKLRLLSAQAKEKLALLLKSSSSGGWLGSGDEDAWRSLSEDSTNTLGPDYGLALTNFLAKFSCLARWKDASVATGIAKRAMDPDFRGDMPVLYDRFIGKTCSAGKALPPDLIADMSVKADSARGN